MTHVAAQLDAWFVEHKRGEGANAFAFPHGDKLFIVIAHGRTMWREGSITKGERGVAYYRPEVHDVLVYDSTTDVLGLKAGTKGEKAIYREVVGATLFEDPNYFSHRTDFSLAPLLQQGPDVLACEDIPGMNSARLIEVRRFLGGEANEKQINQSDDLFRTFGEDWRRPLGFGRLTGATFEVSLGAGKEERTRKVGITPQILRPTIVTTTMPRSSSRGFRNEDSCRRPIRRTTTSRPLKRLWMALEELPAQMTNRRDWQARTADDWEVAKRLLRQTGRVARSIECPFPGGDGCPRKVVRHDDGRLTAVCGERPHRCDRLDLRSEDLEILELEQSRLCSVLCKVLDLAPIDDRSASQRLIRAGRLPLRAGLGVPVFVGLPDASAPINALELPEPSVGEIGGLLLTPTGRFVAGLSESWTVLPLRDLVEAEGQQFAQSGAAVTLLANVRSKFAKASSLGVAWAVPPDARWEEMTIHFIAPHVINVTFRRETRPFEFFQLGMRRSHTGEPTLQWLLLQKLADARGEISWSSPVAEDRLKK